MKEYTNRLSAPAALPALVDEDQLATRPGAATRTVLNWTRSGKLPRPVKPGKAGAPKRWLADDVSGWIKRRATPRKIEVRTDSHSPRGGGGMRTKKGKAADDEDDRIVRPGFRYYDLKRNWRKVEPHLSNGFLNHVLVTEFNKFTFGRWGKTFKRGQYPRDYESCDWSVGHKGPEPRFWRYVKHAACHWIVNFTLVLAQLVEPNRQWRIITSDRHSTVWDGKDMLFDFNFQAMGISADECFELANEKMLRPGQVLETFLAEHYAVNTLGEMITWEDKLGADGLPQIERVPIIGWRTDAKGRAEPVAADEDVNTWPTERRALLTPDGRVNRGGTIFDDYGAFVVVVRAELLSGPRTAKAMAKLRGLLDQRAPAPPQTIREPAK
jgi:hypothetical protein